jgi:hypothetical protein
MSAPVVILLALAAALVGIFAGGAGSAGRRRRSPDVDEEELAQAEDELRQLDAGATPEEAEEELDDWGPGAPK